METKATKTNGWLKTVCTIAGLGASLGGCGDPLEEKNPGGELGVIAQPVLINPETGETYRPTPDDDGQGDADGDGLDDPPAWVVDHLESSTTATVATASSNSVTISGRVFFNDRRQHGLFSARQTPAGATSTGCNPDGVRDDGSACSENWAGAQYAVVDVIERDEGYFAPTAWDCKREDIITSVSVSSDGSFRATFYPQDDCDSDSLEQIAIVLKVRLRYCGTWCFSVNQANGNPYALYHPGASPSDPLLVDGGDVISVGDMNFHPGGTSPGQANDTAIAANHYASLVDTILTLHRDNGIPFYDSEFGEIGVEYPSTQTESATTLSPTKIAILDSDNWIKGDAVPHEYGHVMTMRAWDGDYGWDGVGNDGVDWSGVEITSQRIAFKEAWGNFIKRAVYTETMPCNDPTFDDNATRELPGPLGQGSRFVDNIYKLLCDWYDTRVDDDRTLAGAGDHFSAADLYSVWYNLRQTYLDVDAYGGNFTAGLTICDYINYYLDVRKSTAAVGSVSHADYVAWITDLAYNNNIACFLPSP